MLLNDDFVSNIWLLTCVYNPSVGHTITTNINENIGSILTLAHHECHTHMPRNLSIYFSPCDIYTYYVIVCFILQMINMLIKLRTCNPIVASA